MNKISMGLIVLAFVLLISGSYAILNLEQINNTVIENQTSEDSTDSIANTTCESEKSFESFEDASISDNIMKYSSFIDSYGVAHILTVDDYRSVKGTNLTVLKDVDYTDMWSQCPVCGGYNALGNITKPLPEEAICHDACGAVEGHGNPITYEEAMAWLNSGTTPYRVQVEADTPQESFDIVDSDTSNVDTSNMNDGLDTLDLNIPIY